MLTAVAFASALLAQPDISFQDSTFTIAEADQVYTVSLSAITEHRPVSADRLRIELDGTVITFDNRGIGIHYADKGGYTGLPSMTNTRKLWSVEEILENVRLIEAGVRQAALSAISGYELLGDTLYLLARWDDVDGQTWLEAFVRIEIGDERPQAHLVGRFDGYSMSTGPVSDTLESYGDQLVMLVRDNGGITVAMYDPYNDVMSYERVADGATNAWILPDRVRFLTEQTTPYGTTFIGMGRLDDFSHRRFSEIRGSVTSALSSSYIICREAGGSILINVGTGARHRLLDEERAAATPLGVLVWSPRDQPERARLVRATDFKQVADWQAD